MRICLIGSTGLTGSFLVNHILADETIQQLICAVRKPTGIQHPKYTEICVDFEHIAEYSELYAVDCIITCLGTTLAKAKTTENQKRVDYTYQFEALKAAQQHGVPQAVVLSSYGANPNGTTFYQRIKGKLDADVQQLGFKQVCIVRPAQIAGPRKEKRVGERIALRIMRAMNAIGLFRSLQPIEATDLAFHILRLAKNRTSGIRTLGEIQG